MPTAANTAAGLESLSREFRLAEPGEAAVTKKSPRLTMTDLALMTPMTSQGSPPPDQPSKHSDQKLVNALGFEPQPSVASSKMNIANVPNSSSPTSVEKIGNKFNMFSAP